MSGAVISMPTVIVVSKDSDVLCAAIEEQGIENVWWALDENVENRILAQNLGLARYHLAGVNADQEAFDIVLSGKKESPKKKAAPKPKTTSTAKKAESSKDDSK